MQGKLEDKMEGDKRKGVREEWRRELTLDECRVVTPGRARASSPTTTADSPNCDRG
jgi:hypothetical protein